MESLPSSFRDPSGFVFSHRGEIYRQINQCFLRDFDCFVESGLYVTLAAKGLIVAHDEVTDQEDIPRTSFCGKLIKPRRVPYVSYPYEWSFSQLKDAAILTLKVQALALKYGFTLKDASAYNVQFVGNKPIFIDTLSFAPYVDGEPWSAYRQFCQHFVAPLALMAYVDVGLAKLLTTHIDGIPLGLASKLLPLRTRIDYGLMAHLHFHAKAQKSYSDTAGNSSSKKLRKKAKISKNGLRALLESLAALTNKLEWTPPQTEWGDYYENTNYDHHSAHQKRETVDLFLGGIPEELSLIQDLGANTGEFSRIAAKHCANVISQDIDPVAVERNYRQSKLEEPSNILPLIQNLTAPSPSVGWANKERDSFVERGNCGALLALALIHHLAISNNTPLSQIASLFALMTTWLIIEFVPKSDSQVVRLLTTRQDIFPQYTRDGFETAFAKYFDIDKKVELQNSERLIYLMKSKLK